VPERIDFKLAVLMYSCLQGTAPSYLVDELHRATDLEARRRLRSASLPIVRHTCQSTSSCLEQSSTSSHVRTVSDYIPKSPEELSLSLLFPVTSLYILPHLCSARAVIIRHFGHFNRSFYLLTY